MLLNTLTVTESKILIARHLKKKRKAFYQFKQAKKGKKLSEATLKNVADFYHGDEFTRQTAGKKYYVGVSINQHMQKRPVLNNLKELYLALKTKFLTEKVGFSKPNWCITAWSS